MTSIKELKNEKQKFKGEHAKYVEISNLLGHKYREAGQYEEAVEQHLASIAACDKIKNQMLCLELKAVSRRALGECYSEMSKHSEALEEHNQFLSLTLQMNEMIEIQRAHATLGRTFLLWALDTEQDRRSQRAILHKSLLSFEKALELSENLMSTGKLKDRQYADMKSRLLLNLGLVHENLANYDKCKPLLFDSIQLTKANYLYEELFRCQISLGSIFEKLQSNNEALEYYEQALETAKGIKNKIKQFDAFVCLGLIWMKLENVEKSRSYFKRAFRLGSPVPPDDQQKAARLLKIVSIILEDRKRLDDNLECPQMAIQLCDRLGDHFVEMKCFDSAISYYKKELRYATEVNESDSVLAKIYVSIGETYLDAGNYQLAIDYFTHEYNFNLGNKCEQCRSLLKIADIEECWLENIDELELPDKGPELCDKIISTYTSALNLFDGGGLVDRMDRTESRLFAQTVKRFANFLERNHLQSNRQKELRSHLSKLNDSEDAGSDLESDEEMNADTQDLYDSYSLDLLSDCSDWLGEEEEDDEEELPENLQPSRSKRNPKLSRATNRLNQFGETPLHTACIAGNIVQVERLIEQKANLNAKDYCGWTPLHEACNHGHVEVVERLLSAGAFIESCDDRSDRITALHDACNCGHFTIIRLLLRFEADVLARTAHNETPVECLINWRRRSESELSKQEIDDCLQLELQLMNAMKEKGFDLNNFQLRNSTDTQPPLSMRNTNRSKQRNLVNYDLYSSEKHSDRSSDEEEMLVDRPGFGRRVYQSTIESFRRNRPTTKLKSNSQIRQASKSALISDVVVRDDWLIDDMPRSKSRKRNNKNDNRIYGSDSKKLKQDSTIDDDYDFDDDDLMSAFSNEVHLVNDNDDDDEVIRPRLNASTTTIEVVEEEVPLIRTKTSFADVTMDIGPKVIAINFDDMEKSSFAVPLVDSSATCKWLVTEVGRRYFRKYGIKPQFTLKKSTTAVLADDDLLADVVGANESISAVISSWTIDPAEQRYRELCAVNDVPVDESIESCLKIVNISSLFRINNAFIASNRQVQLMFQTLFRQQLKELDISYTNMLATYDSYQAFHRSLTSISTLERLVLRGVCFPIRYLSHLLNVSPVLKHLDLSFNPIGDDCTYTIVQIIKVSDKLESLSLVACDLSEAFVRNKLLSTAVQNSNLRALLLDYNDINADLVDRFKKLGQCRLFLANL